MGFSHGISTILLVLVLVLVLEKGMECLPRFISAALLADVSAVDFDS